MAKAGWWGGDPDAVGAAPVDSVIDAAEFENFTADYQRQWVKMNRKEA